MTSDWAIEIHNERMESDPAYVAEYEGWMEDAAREAEHEYSMRFGNFEMDESGEAMFPMFIGD